MTDFLKHFSKKLFAVIVVMTFLISSALPAKATDIGELQKQRDVIKSKMDHLKKNILKVNSEKKDVLSELYAIEEELKKALQELAVTENKLRETQQKLDITKNELVKAEEEVENHQDSLNTRMRAMYMCGPVDYIEVLLDSSSFSDFLTRLDIIKKVVDCDKKLLGDLKIKKEEIAQKKAELEEHKRQIAAHHATIKSKRTTIASRKGDRQRLLANLEKQKQEYERQEEELRKDSARLAKMIQQIQAKSNKGFMGTGIFQWPVPSSTHVTCEFGWRIHPIFKTRSFHDGIDIGASMGNNVVAADDGQVIYAGSYGGYGITVIIDHGGQISTQYSHLSKILVSNGQSVSKGDKIGLIGSTGWSTGPHLHFSVIQNGQQVSPWNWLK